MYGSSDATAPFKSKSRRGSTSVVDHLVGGPRHVGSPVIWTTSCILVGPKSNKRSASNMSFTHRSSARTSRNWGPDSDSGDIAGSETCSDGRAPVLPQDKSHLSASQW